MTKMREAAPRFPSARAAEGPLGASKGPWLRTSAALLLVLLFLAPGTASAQTYPPDADELAVSTSVAGPGDLVTISGDGFLPGATVTITFESTPVVIGEVRADAEGRFTTDVRIPLDATPGVHTIRATGPDADGGTRVLSALITIVGDAPAGQSPAPAAARSPSADPPRAAAPAAGPAPARRGGVAFTGGNLALVAGLALALLGGGVAVLGVVGRRAGGDGAAESPARGTVGDGDPE